MEFSGDEASTVDGDNPASESIMEQIERTARLNLERQRLADELEDRQRERERKAEREKQYKVIEETKETIRKNKELLLSTQQTLGKMKDSIDSFRKVDQKYTEFKDAFDIAMRRVVDQFTAGMALENEEALITSYGAPKASSVRACAQLLKESQRVVFLTGAGISLRSGIPMYKNSQTVHYINGEAKSNEEMARISTLINHPYEFWERMYTMAKSVNESGPNISHSSIQKLAFWMKERGRSVKIVTQNIDGYHKVNMTDDDVCEIHGSLRTLRCLNKCSEEHFSMGSTEGPFERVPECPRCRGYARPNILLFDETYDEEICRVSEAGRAVKEADCLVVIGSQLKLVFPRKLVTDHVKAGKPLIEINNDPVVVYGDVHVLRQECENCLPEMVNLVINNSVK